MCELESKLDKVSTTHGKHCLLVHLSLLVQKAALCAKYEIGGVCEYRLSLGEFIIPKVMTHWRISSHVPVSD